MYEKPNKKKKMMMKYKTYPSYIDSGIPPKMIQRFPCSNLNIMKNYMNNTSTHFVSDK